jgi:glucose/arabinose dehydrogenase
MKKVIIILIFLFIGISGYFLYLNYINQKSLPGSTVPINQIIEIKTEQDIAIFIENLDVPWEIAFIDAQTLLVTERKGNLLLFKNQKIIKSFPITETNQSGEGGLLGIAIHPKFKENNFIYLYVTTIQNNKRENRVLRYTLKDEVLKFDRNILTDIRANIFHNAGKISFGPDGYLYVTAGDALDEPAAQDRNQLAGKILRITDVGGIPEDNPFDNPVYSLGHRNPQGLTWDQEGNLWSTEHGQSGAVSGLDELNKIMKGMNYGWPDYRGFQNADGFVSPEIHSGKETWAPGDSEFYKGIIYFTGLKGEALYGYNPTNKELKKYLAGEYGRLRALTLGPDGFFYISTSNRDGRGTPKQKDDKIIKVNPEILK